MSIIWIVLLLSSGAARAAVAQGQELATYLSSRIEATDRAFTEGCAADQLPVENGQDSYEFRHFFLTLAPHASFGFNQVLNLEVSPEITFVWERVPLDP